MIDHYLSRLPSYPAQHGSLARIRPCFHFKSKKGRRQNFAVVFQAISERFLLVLWPFCAWPLAWRSIFDDRNFFMGLIAGRDLVNEKKTTGSL